MAKPCKNGLTVSDHAVVRYLERVLLMDIDGLRERVAKKAETAHKHGAQGVISEGFSYKIRETTVVSVFPVSATAHKQSQNK